MTQETRSFRMDFRKMADKIHLKSYGQTHKGQKM